MTEEELIEALANAEHASWARWMKYLFDVCEAYSIVDPDGFSRYKGVLIPPELVERWQRQLDEPYAELSEREKQSDRDEVAHILPIIQEYAGGMATDAINHTVDRLVQRPLDLIDQAKLASSLAVLDEKVSRLQAEVFSLQGKEQGKEAQKKLSDLIPIECEVTPTTLTACLAWDKIKNVTIQLIDVTSFADEICIGLLWQNYAKEILEYIQTKVMQTKNPGPNPEPALPPMPNPTPKQVEDPVFRAIWNVIKSWDVNVPEHYVGYCGATGSHVMLILNALKSTQTFDNPTVDSLFDQAKLAKTVAQLADHIQRLETEVFSTAIAKYDGGTGTDRTRETLLGRVNELSSMADLGDVDQSFF